MFRQISTVLKEVTGDWKVDKPRPVSVLDLVEDQEDCHNKKSRVSTVLTVSLATLVPILLPVFHMLIFYALWGGLKKPVNKANCSCTCWDTIFKGAYENGKRPGYKHVYFNSNSNTFKMWILTVFFILFLYSSFRRFFSLLFSKKIRWSMAILFLSNLHNQYYAWWVTWNYLNEDFYRVWIRQWFFTVTEAISLSLVLLFMDNDNPIQPYPLLIITVIATFHVLTSATDQFIQNVMLGYGRLDQVIRDSLFMSSDLMICFFSLKELKTYCNRKEAVGLCRFLLRKNVLTFSALIFFWLYVFSALCPYQ